MRYSESKKDVGYLGEFWQTYKEIKADFAIQRGKNGALHTVI